MTRSKSLTMRARLGLGWLAALVGLSGCGGGGDAEFVPKAEAPSEVRPAEAIEPPEHVRFVDVTEEWGIDFVHENAAGGEKLLPETMGSGVAAIDYDTDGDQDLVFINQQPWSVDPEAPNPPTPSVFRNDGAEGFVNVTEEVGLDVTLFGMGAVVGDYDNDGDPDLYITTLHGGRLFRNEDGRFVDVTEEANAGAGDGWLTSGAFFDLENDGDLDLFLCTYVDWSPEYDRDQDFQLAGTGSGRAYGPPTAFPGDFCVLLRNDGDGTFTDISEEAGLRDLVTPELRDPLAKALGVAPHDINGDGYVDLAVGNDTVRNFLLRNEGDGTFRECGIVSGVAFDQSGGVRGAMGTDWAAFRNDESLALAIANFANEMTALYVTDTPSELLFYDMANIYGLGAKTQPPLKFGLFFFDFDLDGRLDLLQVNGHLEYDIEKVQASQSYRQPAQLFWNSGVPGSSLFVLLGPDYVGSDLFQPIVGRGSTYADLDNDGDLDVVMVSNGEPAIVLRNDGGNDHHWLRVRLVGRNSNRDGIGAKLALEAGELQQNRQHFPAKGYLSSVEMPITFGLGDHETIDQLTITWPSGQTTELRDLKADQVLTIDEEAGLMERE